MVGGDETTTLPAAAAPLGVVQAAWALFVWLGLARKLGVDTLLRGDAKLTRLLAPRDACCAEAAGGGAAARVSRDDDDVPDTKADAGCAARPGDVSAADKARSSSVPPRWPKSADAPGVETDRKCVNAVALPVDDRMLLCKFGGAAARDRD